MIPSTGSTARTDAREPSRTPRAGSFLRQTTRSPARNSRPPATRATCPSRPDSRSRARAPSFGSRTSARRWASITLSRRSPSGAARHQSARSRCLASAAPSATSRRPRLAAVLDQALGSEEIAEGRVEPARADGRQLGRVSDQDRLAAGLVDQGEDRRQHPGLGHPGLVDHQDASSGKAARAPGLEDKGVQGRRRDPGRPRQLVGRPSARRGAEHRHPRARGRRRGRAAR
jgi:hypothetical protein